MWTFGVSMFSSQQKETYKHEKLLQLYWSGNMDEARIYLNTHVWYFINQTRWQVSDDLYLWTAAESVKVLDENIIKQIQKKAFSLMVWYWYTIKNKNNYNKMLLLLDDEEVYLLENCFNLCIKEAPLHINPIKMWRYLIWRLWWHLMNLHREQIRKAPIENIHTDDIPTNLVDEIDMDMTHQFLWNIWMTEDECNMIWCRSHWMWEKNILDITWWTRPYYRRMQNKIKKKLADYYYSQWILNEINIISTEWELQSS